MTKLRAKNLDLAVRKVGASCHIGYSSVNYSVPSRYFGHMVFVRASADSIDILNYDGLCIASHKRCFVKNAYITNAEHMPPYYLSQNYPLCYDGAKLRQWADEIGVNTFLVIDHLLNKPSVEQHAYKSCLAVLLLSKKHGKLRLERACRAACLSTVCYSSIKKSISH
jgi:hypothetical protein